MKRVVYFALLVLFSPYQASAQEPDLALGAEIFETCAPCHGPFGQGGGGGVYPRLAGMDEEYIAIQLERFKSRRRENIPMIPYANDRELPDDDVEAVSAYIQSIELQTRLPDVDGVIDGYTRLKQAKQVLNIPRYPGDDVLGAKVYGDYCARCHGKRGQGSVRGPRLAGQHIVYLKNAIDDFLEGKREHKSTDVFFEQRTPEEREGVFSFLSLQDDLTREKRDADD